MTVQNLDDMIWPLDTSVRVALFVPTTPDGRVALGAARSVYYCPRVHGAIDGLTFELYALVEDWVDTLRLAQYLHSSYTFVIGQDAASSPLLRASFPLQRARDLDSDGLYVGVDECPNLSYSHAAFEAESFVDAFGQHRRTRVVRMHMQNHHILAYIANRFYDRDRIELTVGRDGTKREAAFALLYMHHPERDANVAAAAAEAAMAQRKRPVRTPAAQKDTASMFRGRSVQSVLAWTTPDKMGATPPVLAIRPPGSADVTALMVYEHDMAAEKHALEKTKKKRAAAPVRRRRYAPPSLRLVRTMTIQAVFLQQMQHLKIDAFVHEHERDIAVARAQARARANSVQIDYEVLSEGGNGIIADTTVAASDGASLMLTSASTLVACVPRTAASHVTGRLTPGPIPPPTRDTPDDVRRAYGSIPPLLINDIDDPHCVHWLAPLTRVAFQRQLGASIVQPGGGRKRARESPTATKQEACAVDITESTYSPDEDMYKYLF